MMTNDDVCAAVRAGQDELAREASGTPAFVYDNLYALATESPAPRDRIRATELLGKLQGLFVQRTLRELP